MKRKLIWRPDALADLNEVEAYTLRTWGGAQAKRYAAAMVADIKSLRLSALRYPLYEHAYPGLRRKRSGMHHISYLTTKDCVDVLNIIHMSRDPALHLRTETWRDDEGE